MPGPFRLDNVPGLTTNTPSIACILVLAVVNYMDGMNLL